MSFDSHSPIRPVLALALLLLACGEPEDIPTVRSSRDPAPGQEEEPPVDDAVPACPPLRAEVGGEAVEVPHGFAVRSGERLTVHLLNHDAIACEQVLAGGWPSPRGQVWMRAQLDADGDGRAGFSSVTVPAEVEALRRPTEIGAPVELCLRDEVELPVGIGRPRASLRGRIAGIFCGERSSP